MMQKLKEISLIMVMSSIIILSGCQSEKIEENAKLNTDGITMKRITKKDISLKAIEKLSSIENVLNKKTNGKNVFDSINNFTVDTNIGKYIENGNYHSYTFPLKRTLRNNVLENFVLSSQHDGTYKTAIVTYNLSADEKLKISKGENIDVSAKTSIKIINFNASSVLGKLIVLDMDGGCWEVQTGGSASTGWEYITGYNSMVCPWDSGSGGGGGANPGQGHTSPNDWGSPATPSTGGNTGSGNTGGGGTTASQPAILTSLIADTFAISLTGDKEAWYYNQSDAVKVNILQFLSTHNNQAGHTFVHQMISIAVANGSSFTFTNNPTNPMGFTNPAAFEAMLNNVSSIPASIDYYTNQVGQVAANARFLVTGVFGGGIKVRVLQNTGTPYSVAEVTSNTYGTSIGFTWTQTGQPRITVNSNNTTTIVVDGIIGYTCIFASIGTFHEVEVSYQVIINNTNGQIISATRLP